MGERLRAALAATQIELIGALASSSHALQADAVQAVVSTWAAQAKLIHAAAAADAAEAARGVAERAGLHAAELRGLRTTLAQIRATALDMRAPAAALHAGVMSAWSKHATVARAAATAGADEAARTIAEKASLHAARLRGLRIKLAQLRTASLELRAPLAAVPSDAIARTLEAVLRKELAAKQLQASRQSDQNQQERAMREAGLGTQLPPGSEQHAEPEHRGSGEERPGGCGPHARADSQLQTQVQGQAQDEGHRGTPDPSSGANLHAQPPASGAAGARSTPCLGLPAAPAGWGHGSAPHRSPHSPLRRRPASAHAARRAATTTQQQAPARASPPRSGAYVAHSPNALLNEWVAARLASGGTEWEMAVAREQQARQQPPVATGHRAQLQPRPSSATRARAALGQDVASGRTRPSSAHGHAASRTSHQQRLNSAGAAEAQPTLQLPYVAASSADSATRAVGRGAPRQSAHGLVQQRPAGGISAAVPGALQALADKPAIMMVFGSKSSGHVEGQGNFPAGDAHARLGLGVSHGVCPATTDTGS